MNIKIIIVTLLLNLTALYAAEGYQEVAQEQQQAFHKEMKAELKKQLPKAPKYVRYLYKVIGYQPIWVDKDYLSYHTEMLLSELKNDFKKGLHKDLVAQYKALLPDENKAFASDSIEDRAKMEIGIMKLYAKSIDEILKYKKSKYDAVTLLKKAVEEKSIMSAIDEIADDRIIDETFQRDLNLTVAQEKQAKYRALAARLIGKDKDDRLKVMYELLDYKPIWITEKGLTDYTETLFSYIESDITLEKNASIYKEFEVIKNSEVSKDKKRLLAGSLKLQNFIRISWHINTMGT